MPEQPTRPKERMNSTALTLVLLPGMDGTGELFAPFVEALAGEFPIHIVRYPLTETHGYAGLVAVAEAALPPEGSLVLVGESFSGPIAIALAAAHPERVAGLVLGGSFARNPRPLLSVFRALTPLVGLGRIPVGLASAILLGDFATPRTRAALGRAFAKVPPSVLRARLEAVLAVDVTADLAKVLVPVLYLRALQDRLVPESSAAHIAKHCSRTQVVDLEGAHAILQASPEASARAVAEFVRTLASRR
jgi:pimeloyl-[acyl-carrier protein] methyl ester esterase